MTDEIKRPLSLTPSLSPAIGNERSQKMISDTSDEGFVVYCDLIRTGWDHVDALRAAVATMVGSLECKIHHLVEEADSDE